MTRCALMLAVGGLAGSRLSSAVLLETAEDATFADYVSAFSRTYAVDSEEYAVREAAFDRNLRFIKAHNSLQERRWTAGLNALSDRTDEEFDRLRGWRGGKGENSHASVSASFMQLDEKSFELADDVDWRKLKMGPDVPNQGDCGSCWAIAAVTVLQANAELHLKDERTFSPQQLVDCVPNPRECGGQGGCQGATVELAMAYAQRVAVLTAEEVKYTMRDGECKQPLNMSELAVAEQAHPSFLEEGALPRHRARHGHTTAVAAAHSHRSLGGGTAGLLSWSTLPSNKAKPLMAALMNGPVAISVCAKTWLSYQGGIYDNCDKDCVIDHAVTLFGYGNEKDNYWLVRNSWGKEWGEEGFVRLLRQDTPEKEDARCGVDSEPDKGVECKPYPKEVTVCGMCGMLYDSVAVKFANKTEAL